jgi:hypothetical protein
MILGCLVRLNFSSRFAGQAVALTRGTAGAAPFLTGRSCLDARQGFEYGSDRQRAPWLHRVLGDYAAQGSNRHRRRSKICPSSDRTLLFLNPRGKVDSACLSRLCRHCLGSRRSPRTRRGNSAKRHERCRGTRRHSSLTESANAWTSVRRGSLVTN